MKSTTYRMIAVAALAIAMMFTAMSCGTQKMGCPGSITQAETPAADQG